MSQRLERAKALLEQATFGGEQNALDEADRQLDAVEAELALVRARVEYERDRGESAGAVGLYERALRMYRRLGDVHGEAETLLWLGTCHLARGDAETGVPLLHQARELSTGIRDELQLSYVERHLAFHAQMVGDLELARQRFEESTRLRREVGFAPGVAANLLAMARIAISAQRPDDAPALLQEARELARAGGATRILQQIEEFASSLR
jgi:tetratricopeptide (TPR) repeat protein